MSSSQIDRQLGTDAAADCNIIRVTETSGKVSDRITSTACAREVAVENIRRVAASGNSKCINICPLSKTKHITEFVSNNTTQLIEMRAPPTEESVLIHLHQLQYFP
jgi:hypothetical protein